MLNFYKLIEILVSLQSIVITSMLPVYIPLPLIYKSSNNFELPITWQIPTIILLTLIFHKKVVFRAFSIYIIMGLFILPVSHQGGSLGYLLTPNFGYLLGLYPLIKIIDNYLSPFENKLKTILKNFKKDKQYFTKNHHGFRRSEKEFIKIIEEGNFKVQSVYKDMFEVEYNRLTIIRMLKISKFLSIIFFKSHPHLNIFHTKKNEL